MPTRLSRLIDKIAIALSAVCIIHCLSVPLLLAVIPVATLGFGGDSHFHEIMLWIVVPTSIVGFALGIRIHRQTIIALVGLVGLAILAIAGIWGHANWSPWLEFVISSLGSLILATAHWRNFQQVRRAHQHV